MWACQFADKSSTIRGIEDVSITCVKISTCRLCGSSDHPELRGCCNRDPKFVAADSIRRCECFDQLSGCCCEYVSMSSKGTPLTLSPNAPTIAILLLEIATDHPKKPLLCAFGLLSVSTKFPDVALKT